VLAAVSPDANRRLPSRFSNSERGLLRVVDRIVTSGPIGDRKITAIGGGKYVELAAPDFVEPLRRQRAVVGCFLEPIASISILVPVVMPVIVKVGIDPVHFGVLSIARRTVAILPWLIPLLLSLIAITMIAELTLCFPASSG